MAKNPSAALHPSRHEDEQVNRRTQKRGTEKITHKTHAHPNMYIYTHKHS